MNCIIKRNHYNQYGTFLNSYVVLQDYLKSSALVCDIFKRHGIGLVTLQPEFTLTSMLGKSAVEKLVFHYKITVPKVQVLA